MSEEEVNARGVKMALGDEAGEPFSFGDREFRLRFLTIASQDAFIPLGEAAFAEGSDDPTLVLDALAVMVQDQAPEIPLDWPRTVRGTVSGLNDAAAAVLKQFQVIAMGRELISDLARLRAEANEGRKGGHSLPAHVSLASLYQWGIQYGLGRHPSEIKRAYSEPLLHVLFDAWWWQNCWSPPAEEEQKTGLTGIPLAKPGEVMTALASRGVRFSGSKKNKVDATNADAAAVKDINAGK